MKKLLIAVIILLAIPSWGSTLVYTNLGAWQAAVGTFNTYDFNSGIPAGFTFTSSAGAGSVTTGCCAFAGQQVWHDIVNPGFPAGTTIDTPGALYAFGGLWDLAGPGGAGTGIDVWVNGSLVGLIDHLTAGTFWGFTSTAPFTQIVLVSDGQAGSQETYELNGMYTSNVPEPATLVLFGSGILAIAKKLRKPV